MTAFRSQKYEISGLSTHPAWNSTDHAWKATDRALEATDHAWKAMDRAWKPTDHRGSIVDRSRTSVCGSCHSVCGCRTPVSYSRTLILTFIFALHFSLFAFSQNPDACEMPGNKKIQKLWEEVQNERKPSVRKELYDQILDAEPDHFGAIYAKYSYQLARAERDPMSKGIAFGYKPMKAVADLCPTYHMYPYYYMGLIAMQKKEFKEALQHFNRFLEIEFDDPRWYPKDYEEKYLAVEEWIPRCAFYDSLYASPVPFDPTVVKGVSSRDNEYLGIVSPDNEIALYIRNHFVKRKNDLTPRQVEEFTISRRTLSGEFDNGKPMPRPFNITENVGSATLTVDNKRMFLTICNDNADGYKNCDIFQSDWSYHGWGDPINLGEGVNGKKSFEGQPTVTPDGKTLYFVSIREDEIGDIDNMDLYVSHLQEDGAWGAASNLGTTINTKGNEKSPFIHEDSHTLYFSSDGHGGLGDFDIYYTRHDSLENWAKPKNIGYPINTEGADVGFFVAMDGKTAYFSSNERDDGVGGWDLFSFPLYKEARPDKVLFLKGKLKDENNRRVTDAVLNFKNMETKQVHKVKVDTLTGDYVAVMNFSSDIVMTVESKEVAFTSRYLSTEDTTLNDVKKMNVEVKKVKVGEAYRLHDITYGSDRFNLDKESESMMGEFAIYLKANPNMKVAIHGHTDNVGSVEDNMALSNKRAKAVYDILVEEGVSASRLSYKGFADTKPLSSNATAEGRAQNRRTEFVITGN